MLTPRLLIVGVIATVCTWFPGNLAAGELWRRPPEANTLDLFGTWPPVFQASLFPFIPRAAQYGTRVIWDPVFLDEFGAGGGVPANYKAAVAGVKDNGDAPCGHCCPLCQGPLPKAEDAADFAPEEPAEVKLREGEPAKLLLQTMKQVRPSILDGTIFRDSRPIDGTDAMPLEGEGSAAIIVRCIRNLEAQADCHRMPEGTTCLSSSTAPIDPAAAPEATPDAVAALRQAGRDLEETANMLEERGLYDQADHLRAVAQEMRIQARAATASSRPTVSYAPTPMPGPGSDGNELAGDEELDGRKLKLRYDGDCNDQD